MKVSTLMTKNIHTCAPYDHLDRVARIMWENDVGALAVVDENGRTTGMITDRDLCMAAYTQGKPLSEIPVWVAASSTVITAHPDDTLDMVHERMRENRVRRLPVVDGDGQPMGIVTIGDFARRFAGVKQTDGMSADAIALTLAAIAQPHPKPGDAVYRVRMGEAGWDVIDREGRTVGKDLRTQGDAVVHAKQLARRSGSAQIIVHDDEGKIKSEFFYQTDERSSLASDDMIPTLAASQPAHAHAHR